MATEKKYTIPKGLDYLMTVRSDQYIELSPDLLGPKMELFSETIVMIGAPLNPPFGNVDTIMERLDDCAEGQEISSRIAAFSNMSAAPIKLEGDSALAGYYDLYATLSQTHESPGKMIFRFDDEGNGHFESTAEFWPMFELRPLGGGQSIFIDTGKDKVPGFPMNVGSSGGSWSTSPPYPNSIRPYRSKPLYYNDVIMITALRDGQVSAERAMELAPPVLAACAKAQAQLVSALDVGAFGRSEFGTITSGSNNMIF